MKKTYHIKETVFLTALVLVMMLLATGCVCPLFSIFERATGLEIKAGGEIDKSIIADELIYPGSVALVQVTGDIERIVELVSDYGVSFSDQERQALEELPESITRQDVGAIVYSTPDARNMVLSYYEGLAGSGWQIDSFRGPGTGIQDSDIIMASKDDRKQALMVSGSNERSFIIFIDFDWDMFEDSGQ